MSSNNHVHSLLNLVHAKHNDVPGISLALMNNYCVEGYAVGISNFKESTEGYEEMSYDSYLQCASLSKTVASAFSIEYFQSKGIELSMAVNELLVSIGSKWIIKVKSSSNSNVVESDANNVTLAMLMNHTALGMHYVYGIPTSNSMPSSQDLLNGSYSTQYGYEPLFLERTPGTKFAYSGGGFIVLQHIIETMESNETIDVITRPFLNQCGLHDFTFSQSNPLFNHVNYVQGFLSANKPVSCVLSFPSFAAGGLCTVTSLASFLVHLSLAYHNKEGCGSISHKTARIMLSEETLLDLGSFDFMGAKIGLGVFVAIAGPNKVMLHQAANDGFRGVYMMCFDGPDRGKGFIILSNGDNPAVLMQCELARELLGPKVFGLKGINHDLYQQSDLMFDMTSVKQESIVNKGLKDLVMNAFISVEEYNNNLLNITHSSKL
eukprot:gene9296-12526_t